jgi:transposase
MSTNSIYFEQLIRRGCGLDVHKDNVVATIRGEGLKEECRTFESFTCDLLSLSSWLKQYGITHIAMESTGVYWKPVFNILEKDFSILLVNARHIKNVPGHKTDRLDSAWIAKLLLSGLLKGSFIPPQPIRELRELYRYKRKLVQQAASERNRLQKVLEDANIKVGSVITDVLGVSGRLIIHALIEGQRDPSILADCARGSLVSKRALLRKSLQGNISEHHRYMLSCSMQVLDNIQAMVSQLDKRIDEKLKAYNEEMQLLQTIPGVGPQTATAILAEIGNDMSVFPSARHLSSWCGICPGNNESAGKNRSGQTTKGNKFLKSALVESAWNSCRHKSKDTFLKRKFHTIAVRRGRKKALLAVAHKLLIAAYYILKNRLPYQEPDNNAYLEKRKQAQIKRYLQRLHELGIEVPSQL